MTPYILFTDVLGPLGLLSTIVCGFAAITSYIYPQQRRFPNVVLLWTCLNDFVASLITAMNWIPGPVKDNLTLKAVDPHVCTFITYNSWAMELSASMLNVLLSYTLYATIVKRIDLYEMRDVYYYKYLAIFWIPTLTIPLVSLIEITHSSSNGYCYPRTKGVSGVKLFAWFAPLIIEVFLMFQVFKVVFSVSHAVRHSVPSRNYNLGIVWLCVRFVGAQCNQILVWLPSTVWQLYTIFDGTPTYAVNFAIAISFGFPAVNGFIVLAGNTPLWNSIFKFYASIHSWSTRFSYKNHRFSTNSSELSEIT
eukprot:Phypoly_transcript_11853.p1 GENE.Phypoly_transcript_11853~~Phypoly_transcript_11853.p1  ORF type:complete len:307 (+),score=3.92 Phypoly_transcript_11853:216-1136(+)